ncbi:MAG TPA: chemotaxis protein CheB [Gammaproteobacteria bacterium]|nr:chemotaxis protein CheB [Gammaproteobacteria bacterium]
MTTRDIIVAGASMGGIETLKNLVVQLPEDLPAALFVVMHLAGNRSSILAHILDQNTALTVKQAQDGEAIRHGYIYVAPPDRHLLLREQHMQLTCGPHENRVRPAIDPLFRSAAAVYRSRVIGIVLSGALDDGTAGLASIKLCGGVTAVQDPQDAICPDMPRSASAFVQVDYCVPVAKMGAILNKLVREPAPEAPPVPKEIALETELTTRPNFGSDKMDELGRPAALACTTCGGPLWELCAEEPGRYRCRIGHAFAAQTLLADQSEAMEHALLAAIRTMGDQITVLGNLAEGSRRRGVSQSVRSYEKRIAELNTHMQQLRRFLLDIEYNNLEPESSSAVQG